MGQRHETGGTERVKREMQYTIVIEESSANFAARVPDLPGCVAAGATEKRRSAGC